MAEVNVETQEANPQEEEVLDPATGQPIEQPKEEPRLYAGKYKTPEELEEAYAHSNREATRMAQVLKQLSAKPQQPTERVEGSKVGFEGFFDKETEAAIKWYIQNNITDFATSQKSQTAYVSQVSEIWEQTKKDYPDLNDASSELFKLADTLLFERGLAERRENGDIALVTPYAYRIAVEAAYAQLVKEAPTKQAATTRKAQATAVSGRATGFTPQGKLTPEQYEKLSDEDKDKYDQWQLSQGRK